MTRQTKWWVLLGATISLYFLARSERGSTFVTDVLTATSRGIRNNNPGNIRKSATRWAGQVADVLQKDPEFVIFSGPEYGIRAMAKILDTYLKRGVDTIEKIIYTWAPPSENNSAAYVASVSRATGLAPNAKISRADFFLIIPAIIKHENGSQPYPVEIIKQGISLA